VNRLLIKQNTISRVEAFYDLMETAYYTQCISNLTSSLDISCLDATEVFIADLIAYSTCFGHHYAHHQELKSIIQWLLPVVFRAVVFQVAGLV